MIAPDTNCFQPDWADRPFFVSSTFRDMHSERDYLARVVFPELQARLRGARFGLIPIDLRWGVDTRSLGATDDLSEAKELLVLQVCLDEVARCRPFLIVVLGDRYGWVPPIERAARVAREKGIGGNIDGKSVTALEIEYGVLDRPEQVARTWFYFRRPLPYTEMPAAVAAVYRDDPDSLDPEAQRLAGRLAELKERIRTSFPDRVREYEAGWDAERLRVVGLDQFGDTVLADLWNELQPELQAGRAPALSWKDQERADLEEFTDSGNRSFVGRAADISRLTALATGETPAERAVLGACVVGEPGAGKSSLFARLYKTLNSIPGGPVVLAHAAGISVRSTAVDDLLLRWAGELAVHLGLSDGVDETASGEELERTFAQLLSRLAASRRVVLLIDALDQFEPSPRARHLTWLPPLFPRNARLITTAVPGEAMRALERRSDFSRLELEPLTLREAGEIARLVCARYHRALNPEVLAVLLARQRGDGASAAGSPLWLELALEEVNLLDADDFARAGNFAGSEEERLHQLLLDTVGRFPPTVDALYQTLLTRAEEVNGESSARAFAALLAVSRAGWPESSLRVLLPAVSGEPWDTARFARLRRSFRAHLVQRGRDGRLDFFHAQARRSVADRYLGVAPDLKRLHEVIVEHLESLPADNLLRQSEQMTHLLGTGDNRRTAVYLATLTDGFELVAATDALATAVTASGTSAATELLRAHGLAPTDTVRLCRAYLRNLLPRLEGRAPVSLRAELADATAAALEGSGEQPLQAELRSLRVRIACEGGQFATAVGIIEAVAPAPRLNWSEAERAELHAQAADLGIEHDFANPAVRSSATEHATAATLYLSLGQLIEAAHHTEASWLLRLGMFGSPTHAGPALDDTPPGPDDLVPPLEDVGKERFKDATLSDEVGELLAVSRISAVMSAFSDSGLRLPFQLELGKGNAEFGPDLVECFLSMGDLFARVSDARWLRSLLDQQREQDKPVDYADRVVQYVETAADDIGRVDIEGNHPMEMAGPSLAVQAFEAAVRFSTQLAARSPRDPRSAHRVASAYTRLGLYFFRVADLFRLPNEPLSGSELSLQALDRARLILRRLVRLAPDDAAFLLDLIRCDRQAAEVCVAARSLGEAIEYHRAAAMLCDDLLRRCPDNRAYQAERASCLNILGDIHFQLAHFPVTADMSSELRQLLLDEQIIEFVQLNDELRGPNELTYQSATAMSQGRQLDFAERAYAEAYELHDRLASEVGTTPEATRGLYESLERLGHVRQSRGDLDGALECARSEVNLREQFAADGRRGDVFVIRLAYCHWRVAELRRALERPDLGRSSYERAIYLREWVAGHNRSARALRFLPVLYARMAEVCWELGDEGAVALFRQKDVEVSRLLAERAKTEQASRDLALSYRDAASFHKRLGQYDEATRLYQAMIDVRRASAVQWNSEQNRYDLAVAWGGMGCYHFTGPKNFSQAEHCFREAGPLWEALTAEFPDKTDYAVAFADSEESLALVLVQLGDQTAAAEALMRAISVRRWLVEAHPGDPTLADALTQTERLQERF